MVAFKPEIVLRVSPVVRPLFFTAWLIDAFTVRCEIVPISRMAPSVRTWPGITDAIAQSTLLAGGGALFTTRAPPIARGGSPFQRNPTRAKLRGPAMTTHAL